MIRYVLCLSLEKDKSMERTAEVAKRFPHFCFHRHTDQKFSPVPDSNVNQPFLWHCLSTFFPEKIQFVREKWATNREFFWEMWIFFLKIFFSNRNRMPTIFTSLSGAMLLPVWLTSASFGIGSGFTNFMLGDGVPIRACSDRMNVFMPSGNMTETKPDRVRSVHVESEFIFEHENSRPAKFSTELSLFFANRNFFSDACLGCMEKQVGKKTEHFSRINEKSTTGWWRNDNGS